MQHLRPMPAVLAISAAVSTFIAAGFGALPANAQTISAIYISPRGDDTANCFNRNTPCRTLGAAYQQAAGGLYGTHIICVEGGAYSLAAMPTIARSITIDCTGVPTVFSTVGTGAVGFTVNIPSGADSLRTVRFKGITLDGSATFTPPPGTYARAATRGIEIVAATNVYMENVTINEFVQQGIYDHRTGGGTLLSIKDSTISNNGGAGIVVVSGAPGAALLDNVTSTRNAYGLAAGTGNIVTVTHSIFSDNSVAGVEGDTGAQITLDNSTVTNNVIGVQSALSVRLSNSNISYNSTAISGASGTFGNNRFSGNGSPGTAPTALGGASSDLGQQ